MALATIPTPLTDALPPHGTIASPVRPAPAGLGGQLTSLADQLGGFVAELDPALLLGADAASLYAVLCRMERLVVAGKTLLAPRIADSGHWQAAGHRSPAGLLSELEGGTAGQAKRTLQTGLQLAGLPSTEEALRQGTLSGAKAAEIVDAATAEPDAESTLLAGSATDPLRVVKERCQRVRAASASRDPMANERRIHENRYFRSWTDAEGAFCYQGRDSAVRGAKLLAALRPVADRIREDRRSAERQAADPLPKGVPTPAPERDDALRSDALFLIVDGPRSRSADPGAACPTDDRTDGDLGLGGPDDLVGSTPPTTIMVRVDLEALRRRRTRPGELCELDGLGPVPAPVAVGLMDDAFVNLVFTEAGDIRAVSHLGRTINSRLRTALAFRDRCCVVPGCGVAYSLEIDHVVPMELGGPTELDNLALLCRHHHRMKTYDGWVLARRGPSDADPRWSFTPLPEFGQEPGLGSQTPDDEDTG